MTSKEQIRGMRLAELTRMALQGKSYEEISKRAHQMVSKQTAKDYLEEVVRRVQK